MAGKTLPDYKTNDYFGKETFYLKILGISFTGNETIPYRVYSFIIIFFGNFMFPVLSIREVFYHQFEVVADMLIYLFASIISFAKTAVVFWNRKELGIVLEKIQMEPFTPNPERGGDKEKRIIETCVKITTIQTMSYWLVIFVTVCISVIYTLSKRIRSSDYHDWELPYIPLTIINITHSPNFEIIWCYQILSAITVVSQFATIDLLMAALLAHISFQFKLLQNNVRRLILNSYIQMCKDIPCPKSNLNKINNSDIDASTIPWKYLQNSLTEFAKYHLAVIEMAQDMENVFSFLLLLAYLSTLGALCFLIHRVTAMENNTQIARCIGEIILMSFQVVTVCFWGEQVISESQNVGKTAFESNFVGTDIRLQKCLAFVIRRSQNPVKLTTGKFADVCLTTFTWIMRTSYSAFMVLRSSNK